MSAKRYASFKEKQQASNRRHWKSEKYRHYERVLANLVFTEKAKAIRGQA